MKDVVEYMCLQFDKEYSDTQLLCPQKSGSGCIGISGYMLNHLLCAFLIHNLPCDQIPYHIEWICEENILHPIIMQDGPHVAGQYIGTRAVSPGLFDFDEISRKQCTVPQNPLYLELNSVQNKEALDKQLISLDSSIHDRFTAVSSRSYHRRNLMLFLAKAVKTSSEEKNICFAQNCLLMFFAPYETCCLLYQYLECGRSQQKCDLLLGFLEKYCHFVMMLLPKYSQNNISPVFFRACFKECWEIELNTFLDNGIILAGDKSDSNAETSLIPKKQFLTVQDFKDLIHCCIQAASYEKHTRKMNALNKALLSCCDKSNQATQAQLDTISLYIKKMEKLRKDERIAS